MPQDRGGRVLPPAGGHHRRHLRGRPLPVPGRVLFDGEGVLDVRKVGLATMMGKMAEEMQDDEPDSPLKVKLGKLADMISRFGYIGAVVIAIMYFGYFILSAGGFAAYFSSGAPVIIQDIVEAVSLAVVIIVCACRRGCP